MNRQPEDQQIMREGCVTIIDATPVEAAQSGPALTAKRAGMCSRTAVASSNPPWLQRVHSGVDEDGFIHHQTVTPGNRHDRRKRDT